MADEPLQTAQLVALQERMQRGDAAAREELLNRACRQLEHMTRKMLKGYPGVHRWAQTDDVLQSALLRLLRALKEVQPASTREFFRLAATQVRRELLDLARHYFGPRGHGANHASGAASDASTPGPPDPADTRADPGRLAVYQELHEQIDTLPAEERETVVLRVYQGMSEPEIAALLGVTVRSIQNYWRRALVKLHALLKDAWAE
jgi:RNA polymerase sigma factor (sigma-70 family)